MGRTLALVVFAALIASRHQAVFGQQAAEAPTWAVALSPDRKAQITLSADGPAGFKIFYDGWGVVPEGRILVKLGDGTALGADCRLERWETREVNETYTQYPGKRSRVINHFNETTVWLRERGATPRHWQVILRAYDDGVAFRYRVLAEEGQNELVVADENDAFRLPVTATGYALPLNSFTTSYEKRYEHRRIDEIPHDWLLGMPLLVQLGGSWLAITEANLTDFAGMYLARAPGEGTALQTRLSPLPDEPKVALRAKLPHHSPWRVVMLGDSPAKLLESDLLLNLNDPPAFADLSWIHTGKTAFPWWNGFYEKDVPFRPGLNTATAKYYIDFCAEAGIPYHSLDGVDNVAWYGGPIVPYQGADIVQGIEGLDLQEVLRYAREKGVKIRLWMHWGAAKAHMAKAFPLYRKWGVEGVMIDFMNRDDQEMVNFMRDVLHTAAENHLTVNFHGVWKPTGLERTYPNLLNSEGAMNYEYDKWDPIGIPPEHDLTLVFTRMLAGPMDFHQGSLRGVPVEQFKPRNEAPLVMGTPCRMLATYVVFQNHLPMAADYPSAYRGHPGLAVLAAIPTTWDDTKVLAAEVGKLAVVARRHGDEWWVGGMTDRAGGQVRVPLGFLGDGHFQARVARDALGAAGGMVQESNAVVAGDFIEVKAAPAGGFVIHLVPVKG